MPARWSRLRPRHLDALLAAGTGLVVLATTPLFAVDGDRPLLPGGALLIGVGTLALVWRRRWPLPVLAVTVAVVLPYYMVGFPDGLAAIVIVIAMYTVAVELPWPAAVGVGVGLLMVWLGVEFVADGFRLGATAREHAAMVACIFAVGVAVGASRRARDATVAHYEQQRRIELERERLRIAREVHDVVSHSLAMINVQAGVAVHVADRRPEQAVPALLEIKEASRVALADLRATLGVLREPGSEDPTPGLHRLDEVVRAGEAAGLEVTVQGDPGVLPAPVDGAAYRIVQEAVTNTVRHARDARHVTIELGRVDGSLRLRVRDDGAAPTSPEPGNGLRGVTERVAALGGRAHAGPDPGGFVVEAEVPVPDSSAVPAVP